MSRVSILLPVRNGLPYLNEAINGILAQSVTDFELIVIDDGSTDGSGDVVMSIGDPRVTLIRTEGVGVAAALNAGLAVAHGDFIARHDADDLSTPDRFAKQIAHFDRHPDTTVVSSCVRFIDANGDDVDTAWTRAVRDQWEPASTPDEIARLLPHTNCLVHGSVMLRTAALRAVGGYNSDLPVAQDYDLWLRLLPHSRFARLPERLYAFRVHRAQVSAERGKEQARQSIAAKLRHLVRVTGLPATPRARIIGTGAGVDLYRSAIEHAGWSETAGGDCDVAIFTDFATVDRDIHDHVSRAAHPFTRIGNFLLPHGVRA